ncbi:MAG: single-stranded-DNA-specific exonuclease RecJ [Deltaproteobacteria bacterium]|nr:MAG: single-stranded-DNA-specific exonuclease RecJ [Deltaproteobacteria bacterium]
MQLRLRRVDEALVSRLAGALRVRPATARCLVGRGVTEPRDAQGFIDPRLAALRPPTGLAGMARAVERIADAVVAGRRIGVFGDYDVDGVTTAALLTGFLRSVGATVEVAVARRDAGYGFTPAAAADFATRGCEVIITGDCGTSDLDAITAAAARGIDVVVVDHHTVPAADTAHPALALVNPHRADSTFPFRGMASVGLAFYVAAAVRTELRERRHFELGSRVERAGHAEPDVLDLLDLVALGTIADLVPLASENRILTALGLRRLQSRARPGVAALLAAAGVSDDREVDARTVAWKLAPRINAPGRLGAAAPSLALLLADAASAAERAQVLEAANTERRALQDQVMAEALAQLGDRDPGPAIVIAGDGWPSGVVGIVAAKLVDRYQRPAFVVGIDRETGIGRGSARTAGGVNLYRALCEAAPWLDRYGGHAAAAGFTVRRTELAALGEALGAACARLAAGSGPVATGRDVDAEVRLAEVDERLAQELAGLGPFGQDNPSPVLVTRNVRVSAVRRVGDGSHLKLTLEDDRATTRSAIGFSLGEREVDVGARVDLTFLPTVSTWQGRRSAELELSDLAVVS